MGRVSATMFPPFPEGEFDIIYADPPWNYKGQLQHNGSGNGTTGGAEAHYCTVTLGDLLQLQVKSVDRQKLHSCSCGHPAHIWIKPFGLG